MDDSKDISFSNLTDTISAQDYDYQNIDLSTIDLSSSITMATISNAPTITISNAGANVGYSNTIWATGTLGLNGTSVADLNQSGKISLEGTNADIDINGRSLMKTLEALEDRLNMLVPNPELEKEWDQLKKLGNRYRKLEKQCRDKATMWAKLKKMPKINIT